jgi:hypothetical protein
MSTAVGPIHRHRCSIDQLVGFTEMFNDTDWRATTGGINFSVLVTALSTENFGDVSHRRRFGVRIETMHIGRTPASGFPLGTSCANGVV